ncbi:MAG: hypothetical protein AB1861_07130 [Cyanobacteriota bacterium]
MPNSTSPVVCGKASHACISIRTRHKTQKNNLIGTGLRLQQLLEMLGKPASLGASGDRTSRRKCDRYLDPKKFAFICLYKVRRSRFMC